MDKTKLVVERLLQESGIRIDGPDPWDIQVHDDRFYARALRGKNLGLGESYMDHWWDCPRLDEFFFRILSANILAKVSHRFRLALSVLPALLVNQQSRVRSSVVARKHYNLDNRLFMSFLDPYNQYSCGYFKNTDDLHRAQANKLELICRKIELKASDHVLDIGSGWGGFARYAAEHYGCKVTGVNISGEQIGFAQDFCKDLPVEICHCDYRDIRGTFDKIVSIGMFEHVGSKNYRTFMEKAHESLKPGGVFLLHTIGNNETHAQCDAWIRKYIFPNGMLPSLKQITKAIEGLFLVEDLHNLGPHYDKTLMAWYRNFQEAWTQLAARFDERFKRMWEYYLLSCAGAFRARYIQVWQIVLTQYGTPQPNSRSS
ncbi:MAG: cyclopropane fatty acyl phospholipid synthase [Thermodesulfobacteriota bacterium]